MGTILPQKHRHTYTTVCVGDALIISAITSYTSSFDYSDELLTETTWICTNQDALSAIETYAQFYPLLPKSESCYGWNSWDYYFTTVTHDDIVENVDNICKDNVLRSSTSYIVIDDGWEHMWGEWEANYKFPKGLKHTASFISSKGFIPGIWTAPLCVEQLTKTALRKPEVLIKDQYGDPIMVEGQYLVDPTSPAGEAFLADLFIKLHADGFRLFKVDFVRRLLDVDSFYDKTATPYDAARRLFEIIRRCVGEGCHIMGCSLPIQCGAGVADSGRTGIDIHNQWEHFAWAVESYTFVYWANRRIWINDVDFLVVRGTGTSLEKETNVMNPKAHDPNPQGFFKRWRRGPVFNAIEAETWANFIAMTGGNVFSSDRISMLNERGLELTRNCLAANGNAAKPLDLCKDSHCAFWLCKESAGQSLLMINWKMQPQEMVFVFDEYGLPAPSNHVIKMSFGTGEIRDGAIRCTLPPHGSTLVYWS